MNDHIALRSCQPRKLSRPYFLRRDRECRRRSSIHPERWRDFRRTENGRLNAGTPQTETPNSHLQSRPHFGRPETGPRHGAARLLQPHRSRWLRPQLASHPRRLPPAHRVDCLQGCQSGRIHSRRITISRRGILRPHELLRTPRPPPRHLAFLRQPPLLWRGLRL